MDTGDAYDKWSHSYDHVGNKTRDLEGKAIRLVLAGIYCRHILELGCGTGKNTGWLTGHCEVLTAFDFSEGMLEQAKQKTDSSKVTFRLADITRPWIVKPADLICCSLVLEHIEDLDFIFREAAGILEKDGQFYICELHPYRQLQGARARFEHEGSTVHLEYFVHHFSDYMNAALRNGFICVDLQEWFDGEQHQEMPRLISYLFRKV